MNPDRFTQDAWTDDIAFDDVHQDEISEHQERPKRIVEIDQRNADRCGTGDNDTAPRLHDKRSCVAGASVGI
jgi:hypothetical protein